MDTTAAYGASIFWWILLVFGAALPLGIVLWLARTPRDKNLDNSMPRSQHLLNDLIDQHNRGEITVDEFARRKRELEDKKDVA